MTKLTKLHAEEILLEKKLASVQLARAKEEQLARDLEIKTEALNEKKVLVEKLPTGIFELGIKHNLQNARLEVLLTEPEAKDLVKQILRKLDNYTFIVDPQYDDIKKSLDSFFGGKSVSAPLAEFEKTINDFIGFLK